MIVVGAGGLDLFVAFIFVSCSEPGWGLWGFSPGYDSALAPVSGPVFFRVCLLIQNHFTNRMMGSDCILEKWKMGKSIIELTE